MRLAVVIGVAVAFVACKRDDGGELKSLDQLAGSGALHACKGPHHDHADFIRQYVGGINNDAQQDAVDDALSALPLEVKERFFEGKGATKIELTSNVDDFCPATGSLGNLASCWRLHEGVVTVYVNDQPNMIRGTLVRAIAYYLTEVDDMLDGGLVEDTMVIAPWKGGLERRAKMGLAFLEDLAKRGERAAEPFYRVLPYEVLRAKSKQAREKAYIALQDGPLIKRYRFESAVYADAFDSHYCSAESRAIMKREFPSVASVLLGRERAAGLALQGCTRTVQGGTSCGSGGNGVQRRNVGAIPAGNSGRSAAPANNSLYSQTQAGARRNQGGGNYGSRGGNSGSGGAKQNSQTNAQTIQYSNMFHSDGNREAYKVGDPMGRNPIKGEGTATANGVYQGYSGYTNGGRWAPNESGGLVWVYKDPATNQEVRGAETIKFDEASKTWKGTGDTVFNKESGQFEKLNPVTPITPKTESDGPAVAEIPTGKLEPGNTDASGPDDYAPADLGINIVVDPKAKKVDNLVNHLGTIDPTKQPPKDPFEEDSVDYGSENTGPFDGLLNRTPKNISESLDSATVQNDLPPDLPMGESADWFGGTGGIDAPKTVNAGTLATTDFGSVPTGDTGFGPGDMGTSSTGNTDIPISNTALR